MFALTEIFDDVANFKPSFRVHAPRHVPSYAQTVRAVAHRSVGWDIAEDESPQPRAPPATRFADAKTLGAGSAPRAVVVADGLEESASVARSR